AALGITRQHSAALGGTRQRSGACGLQHGPDRSYGTQTSQTYETPSRF
ncbi:jg15221, partial [Pararge aegeria aegeria]